MERWSLVLEHLKNNIGEKDFAKWIKPTRLLSGEGDNFILEAPNRFIMEQILSHYDAPLKSTIANIYHRPAVDLSIVLAKDPLPGPSPRPQGPKQSNENHKKNSNLNPLYRFEEFI